MRRLTNDEKQEILLKSNKFTAKQLSEQYGCSRSTILKLWMGNDYHKPLSFRYYVNDNYFSTIDSENKAYILGLITSDGNIYKRNGHRGQLRICLKDEPGERQLLQEVLNDMESTHPIKHTVRNGFDYISFTIVSQQIFDDLCAVGLCQNKTWKLDINKVIESIPDQYLCDFFRGYFDGDGCITATDQERPSGIDVSIACPLSTALKFIDVLGNIGISSSYINDKRKYNHDFGRLSFTGFNKYLFLKYMYDNEHMRLNRKYVRAMEYFKLIETNATNRSENINAVNKYVQFLEQNVPQGK